MNPEILEQAYREVERGNVYDLVATLCALFPRLSRAEAQAYKAAAISQNVCK